MTRQPDPVLADLDRAERAAKLRLAIAQAERAMYQKKKEIESLETGLVQQREQLAALEPQAPKMES